MSRPNNEMRNEAVLREAIPVPGVRDFSSLSGQLKYLATVCRYFGFSEALAFIRVAQWACADAKVEQSFKTDDDKHCGGMA